MIRLLSCFLMLTAWLNADAISAFARKTCGLTAGDSVAIVPHGITEIPEYAFADCIHLKRVELPEGLTKIGDYAFLGCDSLISIAFPTSLTELGEGALRECRSL
ncbi:MAG: leucine-rich repeat domain-containing protein, partial [Muribaculaceae bacterium]|nr:leucine-rich repeat domain-containing protein [Muribaculaceae bacterium]